MKVGSHSSSCHIIDASLTRVGARVVMKRAYTSDALSGQSRNRETVCTRNTIITTPLFRMHKTVRMPTLPKGAVVNAHIHHISVQIRIRAGERSGNVRRGK